LQAAELAITFKKYRTIHYIIYITSEGEEGEEDLHRMEAFHAVLTSEPQQFSLGDAA
jgi:hypothetical protein